jgi:prepilin-type N-terminal cleavage/methylation domain-containing protein
MKRENTGYSLMELVIVIVVFSIAGTAVAVNIAPMFISLNIEQIEVRITSAISQAQQEALKGNSRTFSVEGASTSNHPGINLTDKMPQSKNECGGSCSAGEQILCVSGKPFCYREATSFTFEQFSGELSGGRAIFLVSRSRKLAVLVSPDGKITKAELINGEWREKR